MKILQIGKFYPVRGGIEKVMYDLMLGLSSAGVYCDMLCASTENYPAGTRQINAYARLIVVPTRRKLAATMIAPGMISALRKCAHAYDIVHIHHPDPMAALALYLSGYKGKVVLHWHSDILKQKLLLRLYAPLQQWLIKRASVIVGTTPVYVQQSSWLQGVREKLDFIPIGVEPVSASPEEVQGIKSRYPGKRLIFALGRLVPYKGYAHLIQAAALLDENYKILIGGLGPMRAELEAMAAETGVAERVEFLGFLQDAEVPAYFQACDLLCLSSVWKSEAFAIVQIEAMSCGKPVISTRIPGSGVSWVNAHDISGRTVPAADAASLAEAIVEVLSDPDVYQRLSDGAERRYQEQFTLDIMVRESLRVYRSISGESWGREEHAIEMKQR